MKPNATICIFCGNDAYSRPKSEIFIAGKYGAICEHCVAEAQAKIAASRVTKEVQHAGR